MGGIVRVVAVVLAGAVVSGCAAPPPAARPDVKLRVRSVRDEDTGLETSEWHVEARAPGTSRAWLARADGSPLAELVRARGLFRADRSAAGQSGLLAGGLLLVVADDEADEAATDEGLVGPGGAVDDAVLDRDEGDDPPEAVWLQASCRTTQVALPAAPPRPALEGLRDGPEGQGVRWRIAPPRGGGRTWFDLVVCDALTGGTVFRSLGAGRPADGALDEPLPAGLLRRDRSYVVEVRARSELGLVAVERATRRTLRLP